MNDTLAPLPDPKSQADMLGQRTIFGELDEVPAAALEARGRGRKAVTLAQGDLFADA